MQSIFVKRSRPHHFHRLTSQPATHTRTSLGQTSLTRRRSPTSSQQILGQLWAVVVHIVATPFSSYSSRSGNVGELRMCISAASQLCCLAAVVGLPKFCGGVCRCRAPLGSFSANSVVDFLRKRCLAVLHKFCSGCVVVSTSTSRIGPPPHEISTWRSTLPKSALKTLTPCYHVLAKTNWSASSSSVFLIQRGMSQQPSNAQKKRKSSTRARRHECMRRKVMPDTFSTGLPNHSTRNNTWNIFMGKLKCVAQDQSTDLRRRLRDRSLVHVTCSAIKPFHLEQRFPNGTFCTSIAPIDGVLWRTQSNHRGLKCDGAFARDVLRNQKNIIVQAISQNGKCGKHCEIKMRPQSGPRKKVSVLPLQESVVVSLVAAAAGHDIHSAHNGIDWEKENESHSRFQPYTAQLTPVSCNSKVTGLTNSGTTSHVFVCLPCCN